MKTPTKILIFFASVILITGIIRYWPRAQEPLVEASQGDGSEFCSLDSVVCDGEEVEPILKSKIIYAYVTAYNTTTDQTDSTPCISASQENICGNDHAVACPRSMPFGTTVTIGGKDFTCLDRTARKFDGRFDISFDKDVKAAREFGIQKLAVTIWEEK